MLRYLLLRVDRCCIGLLCVDRCWYRSAVYRNAGAGSLTRVRITVMKLEEGRLRSEQRRKGTGGTLTGNQPQTLHSCSPAVFYSFAVLHLGSASLGSADTRQCYCSAVLTLGSADTRQC
jgi:hypothetical protein